MFLSVDAPSQHLGEKSGQERSETCSRDDLQLCHLDAAEAVGGAGGEDEDRDQNLPGE